MVQTLPNRLGIFEHEWRNFLEVGNQTLAVHRRLSETGTQRVMMRAEAVELRVQGIKVRQIANTDRPPANLVFISWPDTASGGADLSRTRSSLAQAIEIAVDRQDQRAIVGEREVIGGDRNPLPAQFLHFGTQRPRVKHHAIADDRQRAGDNTRRQQRQFIDILANHQSMACIMPALEADHSIGAFGQPVDNFAFAFVAPLCADYGYIRHKFLKSSRAFFCAEGFFPRRDSPWPPL